MKLFICSMLVTFALGDRLENTYLPPNSARTAGGSGSFLSAPSFGGSPSSTGRFSSSGSSFGSGLSNAYLAPSAGSYSAGSYGSSSGQYDAAASRSYNAGPQFRILKSDSENSGTGNYRFAYETENQISQQETGEQRGAGHELATNVHGSYSYTAPDGQHITVNYVADENGFRAQGDHIPTPPPIPAEILQSLAQNAASGGSGGYYEDGPESSGAYQGIEVGAARSASRQYLAPAIAKASQGGYRY